MDDPVSKLLLDVAAQDRAAFRAAMADGGGTPG
jgi:hypothetical protein